MNVDFSEIPSLFLMYLYDVQWNFNLNLKDRNSFTIEWTYKTKEMINNYMKTEIEKELKRRGHWNEHC